MPAAPCTSGSTMTAATRSPCSSSSARMSAGSPGSACHVVEQQRPVEAVEELDPADRHRADRVAVVAVAQAHEARAPPLALLVPPLVGHLQRDLARRRPAVGVEDAPQAVRREIDEALGEADRGRVREPEHRRVGDVVELVLDGQVDRRVAVAVDGAPQRRDAVDVGVARRVVERLSSAWSMTGKSSPAQPCCCVNGCQRTLRSRSWRSRSDMAAKLEGAAVGISEVRRV